VERHAAIASQIRDAHSYSGLIVTSADDIRVRDAVATTRPLIRPLMALVTTLACIRPTQGDPLKGPPC
jgi:hypothetical protein